MNINRLEKTTYSKENEFKNNDPAQLKSKIITKNDDRSKIKENKSKSITNTNENNILTEKNKFNKTTSSKFLDSKDTNLDKKYLSSKSTKNLNDTTIKSEGYNKLNKSTSKITNLSLKENRIKNRDNSS